MSSAGDDKPPARPREAKKGPRPPFGGLCSLCAHARAIASDRGSVFVLCERSRAEPRFSRYPPQPVVNCPGFER